MMKNLTKLKAIFWPCKENNFLPLFLHPKFLNYYALILIVLKILTLPILFLSVKSPFFAEISKYLLLEMINKERAKRNLAPLTENFLLEQSAYLKAKDIIDKDYFSHYSPEGFSPWYWFKIAGYEFRFAGENLAIGFLETKEVHEAFMNSPSHRANILNPEYKEIGISILKGDFQGNEVYVVVEHFGTPKTIQISESKAKEKVREEKEIPPKTFSTTSENQSQAKEISGEEVLPTSTPMTSKVSPKFEAKVLKFLIKNYTLFINILIYSFLICLIFSLLITLSYDLFVFRKFVIDYKFVLPRIAFFIFLSILFLYLDDPTLIKIIPHKFLIHGII